MRTAPTKTAPQSERKTIMNAESLHPTHPMSPGPLLLALAGAALAVAAGFGVATAVLDDPPASTESPVTIPAGDPFNGTDRDIRELMHRR